MQIFVFNKPNNHFGNVYHKYFLESKIFFNSTFESDHDYESFKEVFVNDIKETEEPELTTGERVFDPDLIEAIERGEAIDPIICNEVLEIEDGHHRYELAKKQQLTKIFIIIIKSSYPICKSCKIEICFENLSIKNGKTFCSDC